MGSTGEVSLKPPPSLIKGFDCRQFSAPAGPGALECVGLDSQVEFKQVWLVQLSGRPCACERRKQVLVAALGLCITPVPYVHGKLELWLINCHF